LRYRISYLGLALSVAFATILTILPWTCRPLKEPGLCRPEWSEGSPYYPNQTNTGILRRLRMTAFELLQQPAETLVLNAAPLNLSTLRSRLLQAQPLRLYYYVEDAPSFESLKAHASEIDLLAPQAFWIDSQGSVYGQIPARVLDVAQRAGIPLMPLVFNRRFDRATVSAVLGNPVAQKRAITYLAYLAWQNHCAGFQIDFENIAPGDQNLFTEFVRQAAATMHRYNMLLSVALVPRLSDVTFGAVSRPGAPAPGVWAAAFDYQALGQAADFVTVMTYDNFGRDDPPGPIAGLNWVNRVLTYSLLHIPSNKILMGIPLYGREWSTTRHGYMARSVTFQDIHHLLSEYHLEPRWDDRWQAPWFRYRAGGSLRTVYYENAISLRQKLQLISDYHLKGFAAWRIGSEDPAFWGLAARPGIQSTHNSPLARE
jgi:spore germination protein